MILLLTALGACSNDIDFPYAFRKSAGTPAYVEAYLGETVTVETRAVTNSNDKWSVASFGNGDKVGMYALTGRQNPENMEDFTLPLDNVEMFYEGKNYDYEKGTNPTTYRFGNPEVVINPIVVNSKYSYMYYPYFEDMPVPYEKETLPGIPLRTVDPKDGIEKCIDFMYTSGNSLTLTDGVLKPSFKHSFMSLVIQRGEGFSKAKDDRLWVVMKKPLTDIRVTQSSATSTYSKELQYTPDAPEEDLMIEIIEGESKFKVNKYSVWQGWNGNPYKAVPSQYLILPIEELYFIFIQDDYGNWQIVSDFYIGSSGSKKGSEGNRYILNISLKGVDVVVRPVAVQNWDEEIVITDNRKVGINNYEEYMGWVSNYNTYIEGNRDDSLIDELRKYGDGSTNTVTGYTSWTFYINSDINFPSNEFPRIKRLDDALEGSSTYTNYELRNLQSTMIDEIGPRGELRALDFKDIYIIQPETDADPFALIAKEMNGGLIEKCNVLNAVLVGYREAGMIAGKVTDGNILNCSFSGDVIGVSSADGIYEGLFGIMEGSPIMRNISTTGLKFILN